jgi:hypothetical protein
MRVAREEGRQMPTESRILTFSNPEAIDALQEYCGATKRELPKTGIKRLTFANETEIRVTAEFDGGPQPLHFYENEVAVALIMLCTKRGIPVARRAVKSLQIAQDSISLHLSMRS